MAEGFQKFKNSLNRGVTAISVKTSSSLEKVKIKTHIESLKNEIQRLMLTAGETGYNMWVSGNADAETMNNLFTTIKQKYEEIDALTVEMSAIDERDNQILGNTPVTPAAPAAPAAPAETAENVCSACGTSFEPGAKFCRKCGNKLV